MKAETASRTRRGWIRFIAGGIVLLGIFAVGRELPLDTWLGSLRVHIDALGAWGPVAFAALYIAAALLLVPGSILTLASGALFGVVTGTLTVWIAATASAALAFLVARYFAREAVAQRLAHRTRFVAIDRAIGEQGWKIVGLLRLSPVIPFSISNYLYGLTSIAFGPYVGVSALAMLPATFFYVSLGSVAATGVETAVGTGDFDPSPLEWGLRVVGIAATAAVVILVTRLARKTLRETTDIEETDTP